MPDLIHERRGDIAWITFNRPEARNALTFAMYEELARICEAANNDATLRCIVIRGAGGWLSGYTVPVMAGPLQGSITVDGATLVNRYRATFVGLSNDKTDGDGQPLGPGERNYLALLGIPAPRRM